MVKFLLTVLSSVVFFVNCFPQEKVINNNYQPEVGQEGKDVVWVPTPQALVEKMLDLARVTSADFLIDLGSGDGRTVIAAAKRGLHALGIEYNPDMVELSKKNAARAGVADMVEFIQADLFKYDFSKATVITMFLLPEINLGLQPKLFNMKPGTRIVSNTFVMGEWIWDEKARIPDSTTHWNTALLWIVPAKVEGIWKTQYGELTIKQDFQKIFGNLKTDGRKTELSVGRLRGNEIYFQAGKDEYHGIVDSVRMYGIVKSENGSIKWSARR